MPKPTIAAINGAAAGAGLSFALACDLRLMSSGAVLMMAFSNIGLVPDSGGSWFLARAVGYNRALELAITGRRVAADEALSLGLVEQVVEPDALRSTAAELAATLAARPTQAIAWTKKLMREALTATLAETVESEAQLQAAAVRSHDHAEGVAAFLEKREPRFEGR
jgi:2-(1,2-epoxy-1,2-dihydrophenyl)acetyl-CoA isomerase